MTEQWLAEPSAPRWLLRKRRAGLPSYTLYLAEMVRQVGGRRLFLHEWAAWLKSIAASR